jgi:alpha-1,3-rhamnosyltransferase
MNGAPRISIIVLCFNTGERLLHTLDSIKNQTLKDFEIIIVDDASSDKSVEIIRMWLSNNSSVDSTFIENEINLGIPVSLNKALTFCKAKYIALIGDDTWRPALLERQLPLIEASGDKTALVYSRCNCYEVANEKYSDDLDPMRVAKSYSKFPKLFAPFTPNVYLLKHPYLQEILLSTNIVNVFSALIKKDVLLKAGAFDEKYCFEDYPLWIKLSEFYDFIYVNEPLACYMRYGSNFSTQNISKVDFDILRVLNSSYKTYYNDAILFQLQNRIVTNLSNFAKVAVQKRDIFLLASVMKEGIKFFMWPRFATQKYILKKVQRKFWRA